MNDFNDLILIKRHLIDTTEDEDSRTLDGLEEKKGVFSLVYSHSNIYMPLFASSRSTHTNKSWQDNLK